jgi:ABC-type transport system substrate-binding protein
MVQEIVQDERTVLKRNPDYWRKDASGQQLPYLDTATFRVVRDNTVAYTEMKAGSVDCLLGLEAKYLKEVEANAELVYFPLNAQVNFTSGIYGFNMKRDAWKNKLVRQAFSYGIDRKALSDATGLGYSEPSVAPWAANHIGWDPAWDKSYAYDLTKAKSLMAQAGVKTPVELSFLTAPGDRTGEILQQMLEPVGFKIKIDPADAQTQVGRIKDGNWDVRNWGLGTRPDPALTWSLLKAALTTDNGYTNDKLDAVMAEAGSTFDEKVRAAKYGEGIAMLMDEAVMLTLIRRPNNLVYRKKYKGVSAQYIFADFSAASLG